MAKNIDLLAAFARVFDIHIDPDEPRHWDADHEGSLEGPPAWLLDDDGRLIKGRAA